MDLQAQNLRILDIESKLASMPEGEQRFYLTSQLKVLRNDMEDFLRTEKLRGKNYGSWKAIDFIRKPNL